MVEWVEENDGMLAGPPVEWVGQTATSTQPNGRLSNIEMIALAGVIISGVSLGLSLWSLATKGQLS